MPLAAQFSDRNLSPFRTNGASAATAAAGPPPAWPWPANDESAAGCPTYAAFAISSALAIGAWDAPSAAAAAATATAPTNPSSYATATTSSSDAYSKHDSAGARTAPTVDTASPVRNIVAPLLFLYIFFTRFHKSKLTVSRYIKDFRLHSELHFILLPVRNATRNLYGIRIYILFC